MAKVNLPDVGNLANAAAARATINNNFTAVENAFDNTLSRDGTLPNQMEADIDLNDNDLLNVKRIDADEYWMNGVPWDPNTTPGAQYVYDPLVFTGVGDGVETDFGIPDADLDNAAAYDTYIEKTAGTGDFVAVIPGEDFEVFITPDTSDSYMRFAVPLGNGINFLSILRGHRASTAGGTPPLTTTAPDVVIINNNTTIDRSYQNSLIVIDEAVTVTITVRANTGDLDLDWRDGEYFSILQRGVGKVVLAGETGVVITPPDDFNNETRAQGSIISCSCVDEDTDDWASSGDLLRDTVPQAKVSFRMTDRSVLSASNITATVNKDYFTLPYDFKLETIANNGIVATLATAQASGTLVTVDVNSGGTSLLSTKLTFDNNENTTRTAATPAVYDSAFVTANYIIPAHSPITFDVDAIGTAGARLLSVTLTGYVIS